MVLDGHLALKILECYLKYTHRILLNVKNTGIVIVKFFSCCIFMSKCFSCPKFAQFNCPKCQQVDYCSRQCQISHWPLHVLECQDYCDQQRNIQFYLSQIYLIIKPVLYCIFLSILWVKITYPAEQYYTLPNQSSSPIQTVTSVFYSAKETDSNGFFDHPVYPALLIMGQIIVATVIVMVLFKYRFMRTLTVFFSLVVISLLGYFGYLIILQIVILFNVQLDWVTLIFFLWNFSIVGLLMVFYKGPLWLQQAYLVVISSLMAYSFTRLPDLTTWVLLGLLAVWGKFEEG
jgi:presenilin 1